jgi:MFS transporter, UMF1 family
VDHSKEAPGRADDVNALGGPAASRLGQFSWAMFDWANQPYFTVVTTVIFAPYFVQKFIGDPVLGQEMYSFAIGVSGLCIALLAPVLGAISDVAGRRKPWMLVLSVLFVLSSFMLWGAEPGAGAEGAGLVMLGLILASLSMETAVVFNHSMLPGIAPEARMGRLSGFAWGLGYFGGIVALLVVMWLFIYPGQVDLPLVPDRPLFGIDQEAGMAERLTGPLSALWYVLFVWPLFLFTPDGKRSDIPLGRAAKEGVRSLFQTVSHVRQYGNVVRFLAGRMIYNDGLGAIFAFGGIYASIVFGWGSLELGISGLIMLVFAGLGAIFGGRLDDLLGSRRTIVLALALLIFGSGGVASVGESHIFFFVEVEPVDLSRGLFRSTPEQLYLLFSVVLGLGVGPAQSASRTMMARLAPKEMMTEFFGLYAISGKATAFLAPLLIGLATAATGDARVSIAVIIVMLVVGLAVVLPVKEERAVSA